MLTIPGCKVAEIRPQFKAVLQALIGSDRLI